MRGFTRRMMITTSLGALAGVAMAQPMGVGPGGAGPSGVGMMSPGSGMMMRRGAAPPNFGDRAAYMAGIKAELGITAAQEDAWKTYAEFVNGTATQMQALHQSMWEAMNTATWEERRDMMNRAFQARQQAFQTVHDAALALLSSLSERQKGKAEIILPGLARHRMGGRGMMGPR